MQTSFTAEQLRDPEIKVANDILRSCVHCGMCTATCPTFVLLGDELDSPRGRIYLIKDMLENARPATEEVVRHVDRCLSCLSCMTTCPSGVHYMHLVDHARRHIEDTYARPAGEKFLRRVLGFVLPYPGRFRVALLGAWVARPLAQLLPRGTSLAGRLGAMLALTPASIPAPSVLDRPGATHAAQVPRKYRVALLAGCAQQVLAPRINEATIRLLTRLGVEVVVPKAAGCCGALTHHMGSHDPAIASVKANVAAWTQELENGGLDAVVINASGCGTTVKDYGFMLREDAAWKDRAARISALACDISEFLTRIGYAPTAAPPGLSVAYHAACSLQHGQKITAEPKALLKKAGFTVKEAAEAHLCCGSAGTYNILQPVIAGQLRERKLANIARVKPDVIATGNIGCMTQLSGGTPVVHTVELLDWMAGGPKPANLPAKLPANLPA
jgi:glycolate oxidase iron-sulfur subunit